MYAFPQTEHVCVLIFNQLANFSYYDHCIICFGVVFVCLFVLINFLLVLNVRALPSLCVALLQIV